MEGFSKEQFKKNQKTVEDTMANALAGASDPQADGDLVSPEVKERNQKKIDTMLSGANDKAGKVVKRAMQMFANRIRPSLEGVDPTEFDPNDKDNMPTHRTQERE